MRMDLGTRNTLLYDFMHYMTAVSLEMSDEPFFLTKIEKEKSKKRRLEWGKKKDRNIV